MCLLPNVRRPWLVLLVSLLSLGFLQAETRHLHVLKILDDQNHDYIIREGCRSISYGIDQEVTLMANYLGILNVIEYNINGDDFTLERLDQVLNYEMGYQERDIVLLVYVGHGFRDPNTTSRFPNLYFNSYTESVNFGDIREQILEKNPSLLLNIVVACNVTVLDHSTPPPYRSINAAPEVVTLPKSGRYRELYEGLFADESGMSKTVDLISAQEEHYTFISNDGGIFFNEILYTFQEVLGGYPFEGWQQICQTIEARTIERSTVKGLQQRPICSYNVRLSPVELQGRTSRSFLSPSPCRVAGRELRRGQRGQLRALRRQHRDNMRSARRTGTDRRNRQLLAQEQRVEYENQKLRHIAEYQRHLQQCR